MISSANFTFVPRRPLGRTGVEVTALGIGDIADRRLPIEQCIATVQRALNAGLNLIDTAPGYEAGYSEEIVGQAVKGMRDGVFVIDKIDELNDPVRPQVDASLRRLQMDYIDAFVFHGLSTVEGWRKSPRPAAGWINSINASRKVNAAFAGFHRMTRTRLREAIESGLCDIVMFAIGPYVHPRYVEEILPLARRHDVGTVCFKTFGAGKLVSDTSGYNQPLQDRPRGKTSSGGSDAMGTPMLPHLSIAECLHYTMTIDPDVALLGMSFPNEQDAAFQAAKDFKPLSEAQMTEIKRRAIEAIANKGKCWWNPNGV